MNAGAAASMEQRVFGADPWRRGSKIWKMPYGRKKLFSPANPLKILKTAKEIFAKIWRKQAKIF